MTQNSLSCAHSGPTQIKFTIDAAIVAAFKNKCAREGASMTSVIRDFMIGAHPSRGNNINASSRPLRRKAVSEIIEVLNEIENMEEQYRDAIPEQFAQRYETADAACGFLAEAIAYLEEAYG